MPTSQRAVQVKSAYEVMAIQLSQDPPHRIQTAKQLSEALKPMLDWAGQSIE